jgi:hypothetical protein
MAAGFCAVRWVVGHEIWPVAACLLVGAVPGLHVLTSGPLPPNAAELLGTDRMRQLLADLAARCDIVILDTQPTLALADAAILATRVDGVLLGLDATSTRREMAKRAVASLHLLQARLIGAVMNRVPTRGAGSDNYYHCYNHSGHYYNQDGGRSDRGHGGNGLLRPLCHGLSSLMGNRRPGPAPALTATRGADEAVETAARPGTVQPRKARS